MAEYNETWVADYCSADTGDMSPDVMALCQVHAVSSLSIINVVVNILIHFLTILSYLCICSSPHLTPKEQLDLVMV
jgi:hypothetical protein